MTELNTYEDYRNLPECVTDYYKLREVAKNGEKETITVDGKEIQVVRLYEISGSGDGSHIYTFYVSPETCLAQVHMYCLGNTPAHAKSIASLPGKIDDYLDLPGVALSAASGFGHITVRDESLDYVKNFQKDIRLDRYVSVFVTTYKDWIIQENQYLSVDALGDMGMSEDRCNKHLVFTTLEAAEKYLEWHKVNTETPVYDDYDYAYDDYEYED